MQLQPQFARIACALLAAFVSGTTLAQPTDVFISEYIEGSSNKQGDRDLQRHG